MCLKFPLSPYIMLRTNNIAWCNFCSLFLNIVKRGKGRETQNCPNRSFSQIEVFPIHTVFNPNAGKYGPEKLRIRTLYAVSFKRVNHNCFINWILNIWRNSGHFIGLFHRKRVLYLETSLRHMIGTEISKNSFNLLHGISVTCKQLTVNSVFKGDQVRYWRQILSLTSFWCLYC